MSTPEIAVEAEARSPGIATGLSLLIPITLSTMAIVLLAPILPKLLAEFSDVPNHEYWVPMILTIPALCVALLSPFAGILGDYFGRRKLLIASFVVYAIFGIAPIFLTDLRFIIATRIGVGISEALIMVLSTTMIGDYYKGASRDKWLAGQTACASLSALVFFNLGGFLGNHGWRTPFWVYTSALLMMLAVIVFTWEPAKDGGEANAAGKAPHNVSWAGFPWLKMMMIVGITIYASVFFYTVQIQAASGLNALGLTDSGRIGFLTSVASLGVPIGTFIYTRLGLRLGVGNLLLIEFGMLAVGFMMMSLADTTTSFLVGCFINQLGAGMLLPTLLVWSMSILSFEIRGRGTGMWQSSFAFGQFLSPIVVTFIALRVGGLLPAFAWLSYGAAAGAIVVIAVLLKKGRIDG